MEELIKALHIFLKYGKPSYPTQCEHDIMYICDIDPHEVSDEDKAELDELGFGIDFDLDIFYSFKYGSA